MKKTLTTLLIILLINNVYSQENQEEFTPKGKPFIKVFSNFHSSFEDQDIHNVFEIQRAYLGYAYKMSEKISGKVSFDVGNPGVGKLKMTAYLKNAYFQYKNKHLTTKFGLIGLSQFKLQENQWGGRYFYKSLQDKHKFGYSADIGLFTSYKFNNKISIDATIANGDGYKSVETDSLLKYSVGVTISPIKGLDIRTYYDYIGNDDAQQSLSLYIGYSANKLKVGTEYNQQFNNQMTLDQDMQGLSFYGSYKLEKVRFFGRFDYLSSVKINNATDPWNYGKDGKGIITGLEFSPIQGIKITPNYQAWIPANAVSIVNVAYLSCEIKF
ncbi:MAG: hypothetical protein PF487_14435 [Bacteroidales bacterium]|jgi:hypothetical protein|nr:hypothetical protein [Bacteroidales bacterium]